MTNVRVVVLNDGKTFTDITGCMIFTVPLAQYLEIVETAGTAEDFVPVKVEEIK